MSRRPPRRPAVIALVLGLWACTTDQPREAAEQQRPRDAASSPTEDAASEDAAARNARSRAADWVYVKSGTFLMGSPPDEPGRLDIETQHSVTLTTDFLIQPTEVTQEQFQQAMGYNPSRFTKCGPNCPVEEVSWHEAAAYCNRLSELEGLRLCYSCTGTRRASKCQRDGYFTTLFECPGYRLPAEAEWELAARAGETRATPLGTPGPEYLECESPNPLLDSVAWFCGNSGGTTHPVAQKEPNAFGLYDMLGNVWEWNHDFDRLHPQKSVTDPWGPYSGLSRVGHGGSWLNKGRLLRFAARGGGTPNKGYGFLGFRVVRSCLGDEMASLCRHRYVSRWAEPRAAAPDGGPALESSSPPAPTKAPPSETASPRSRRVSDNSMILIAVVLGVLLLFGLERLLRWRRQRRRRDDNH